MYSKVSGISGFGYTRKGWCRIGISGISVRGGVGCPGYKRSVGYIVMVLYAETVVLLRC